MHKFVEGSKEYPGLQIEHFLPFIGSQVSQLEESH